MLNWGGTKSIERDELSDMLENGKKITFICLYTAVDTDEGDGYKRQVLEQSFHHLYI